MREILRVALRLKKRELAALGHKLRALASGLARGIRWLARGGFRLLLHEAGIFIWDWVIPGLVLVAAFGLSVWVWAASPFHWAAKVGILIGTLILVWAYENVLAASLIVRRVYWRDSRGLEAAIVQTLVSGLGFFLAAVLVAMVAGNFTSAGWILVGLLLLYFVVLVIALT